MPEIQGGLRVQIRFVSNLFRLKHKTGEEKGEEEGRRKRKGEEEQGEEERRHHQRIIIIIINHNKYIINIVDI